MPPTEGNALYSSTWVGVSDEGFSLPSTVFPSKSTTTISSAFMLLYDTPDGLITTHPFSRSMPLTFPHVKITKPCFTMSKLAWNTCCFNSCMLIVYSYLLKFDHHYRFGRQYYRQVVAREGSAVKIADSHFRRLLKRIVIIRAFGGNHFTTYFFHGCPHQLGRDAVFFTRVCIHERDMNFTAVIFRSGNTYCLDLFISVPVLLASKGEGQKRGVLVYFIEVEHPVGRRE